MLTESLAGILKYQELDLKLDKLRQQWEAVPLEVGKLEFRIKEEEARLAQEKKALASLEVKRKELELEISTQEASIQKYKTQQIYVKKTEEYQAFNDQITHAQKRVSEVEDEVIGLIDQQDQKQAEWKQLAQEVEVRNRSTRTLISENLARQKDLEAEILRMEADTIAQRGRTESEWVDRYTRIKSQPKKAPYIVPIIDQKCMGCHMRVSNDMIKKARAGDLMNCDQCSRILYIEH